MKVCTLLVLAMDAKDLRTESVVHDRNNEGSAKFSSRGSTPSCDGSKTYQELAPNPLGKVDVPPTRPCAVIGPDRIIPPPPVSETFHKRPLQQWPYIPDNTVHCPPEYAHKIPEYSLPTRNISPRQTFQENMQRIMMPPRYNGAKISEDHNFPTDRNISFDKNIKISGPIESKYSDVPYVVNSVTNDQKTVRNSDISMSSVNLPSAQSAPTGWSGTNVNIRPMRPYGVPDMYQYPEYPSCAGPRPGPILRQHRTMQEDPSHLYPDPYYHEGNVRFKPYPSVKERFPQQRYEYINNYTGPYPPPPPFPSHKYDIQKPLPPHPYPPNYPQVPLKYVDGRIPEHILDPYQRQNQQTSYNIQFRNQPVHPGYNPMQGATQNKMYSYTDGSLKPTPTNKLPYDNSKMYLDYENLRNKNYQIPESFYVHELHRSSIKNMPPNYQSLNIHGMPHPLYRKEPQAFKHYEYFPNPHMRNMDPSLTMNPLARLPSQFSPNTIAISPCDSNASNDTIHTQSTVPEDCGYVSQSSNSSLRSMDSGLHQIPNDIYRMRYDYRNDRNKPNKIEHLNKSKDTKKNIDVRQFLQSWNEGDEENCEDNSTKEVIISSNSNTADLIKNNNQDQLYVLGSVPIPSEELGKYEHIQKVSKLPENIKGYNSLELLNQFEEVIESSNIKNYNLKSRDPKLPLQSNVQESTINRPVSPLDVESKISQSIIHKEVGCNFEIRPCSPTMMSVEMAKPLQAIVNERTIEKIVNPHGTQSPLHPGSGRDNCDLSHHTNRTPRNKIPSCKMDITQCLSTNNGESIKSDYTIQDLEINSSVCLASLPRLDNDIELNFPEVNQQFIDANKCDNLNVRDPKNLPTLDDSTTNSKKNINLQTLQDTNNEINKDILKLSKYRKNKSPVANSHTDIQSTRTDSVIIKNPENTKRSEIDLKKHPDIFNEASERHDTCKLMQTIDKSLNEENGNTPLNVSNADSEQISDERMTSNLCVDENYHIQTDGNAEVLCNVNTPELPEDTASKAELKIKISEELCHLNTRDNNNESPINLTLQSKVSISSDSSKMDYSDKVTENSTCNDIPDCDSSSDSDCSDNSDSENSSNTTVSSPSSTQENLSDNEIGTPLNKEICHIQNNEVDPNYKTTKNISKSDLQFKSNTYNGEAKKINDREVCTDAEKISNGCDGYNENNINNNINFNTEDDPSTRDIIQNTNIVEYQKENTVSLENKSIANIAKNTSNGDSNSQHSANSDSRRMLNESSNNKGISILENTENCTIKNKETFDTNNIEVFSTQCKPENTLNDRNDDKNFISLNDKIKQSVNGSDENDSTDTDISTNMTINNRKDLNKIQDSNAKSDSNIEYVEIISDVSKIEKKFKDDTKQIIEDSQKVTKDLNNQDFVPELSNIADNSNISQNNSTNIKVGNDCKASKEISVTSIHSDNFASIKNKQKYHTMDLSKEDICNKTNTEHLTGQESDINNICYTINSMKKSIKAFTELEENNRNCSMNINGDQIHSKTIDERVNNCVFNEIENSTDILNNKENKILNKNTADLKNNEEACSIKNYCETNKVGLNEEYNFVFKNNENKESVMHDKYCTKNTDTDTEQLNETNDVKKNVINCEIKSNSNLEEVDVGLIDYNLVSDDSLQKVDLNSVNHNKKSNETIRNLEQNNIDTKTKINLYTCKATDVGLANEDSVVCNKIENNNENLSDKDENAETKPTHSNDNNITIKKQNNDQYNDKDTNLSLCEKNNVDNSNLKIINRDEIQNHVNIDETSQINRDKEKSSICRNTNYNTNEDYIKDHCNECNDGTDRQTNHIKNFDEITCKNQIYGDCSMKIKSTEDNFTDINKSKYNKYNLNSENSLPADNNEDKFHIKGHENEPNDNNSILNNINQNVDSENNNIVKKNNENLAKNIMCVLKTVEVADDRIVNDDNSEENKIQYISEISAQNIKVKLKTPEVFDEKSDGDNIRRIKNVDSEDNKINENQTQNTTITLQTTRVIDDVNSVNEMSNDTNKNVKDYPHFNDNLILSVANNSKSTYDQNECVVQVLKNKMPLDAGKEDDFNYNHSHYESSNSCLYNSLVSIKNMSLSNTHVIESENVNKKCENSANCIYLRSELIHKDKWDNLQAESNKQFENIMHNDDTCVKFEVTEEYSRHKNSVFFSKRLFSPFVQNLLALDCYKCDLNIISSNNRFGKHFDIVYSYDNKIYNFEYDSTATSNTTNIYKLSTRIDNTSCDVVETVESNNESNTCNSGDLEMESTGIVNITNSNIREEENCENNDLLDGPVIENVANPHSIQNNRLKRSYSDSDISSFDCNSVSKRKRHKIDELLNPQYIAERVCNIIQSSRRNSISHVYNNENVSFCILIDNDCIIAEETEDSNNILEETAEYEVAFDNDVETHDSEFIVETSSPEEIVTLETSESNVFEETSECNKSYVTPVESPYIDSNNSISINNDCTESLILADNQKSLEDTWINDVACVETVVSDEPANNEEHSIEQDDNLPVRIEEYPYCNTDCEDSNDSKTLSWNDPDAEQINESLCRTTEMVVTALSSYESRLSGITNNYYDKASLQRELMGSDSEPLPETDTSEYVFNSYSNDFNLENKENLQSTKDIESSSQIEDSKTRIEPIAISDNMQDETVHSCESTIDDVFTYTRDNTPKYSSSSPEVSSTTSEDKNSSILLRITNYNGSRRAQLNEDIKIQKDSTSKTNLNYNNSCTNLPIPRPLITKAAQKYIPPIRESIPHLKVKLPLPQHKLIKFKKLKQSKETTKSSSIEVKANFGNNNRKGLLPKKPKPLFEDVLKSIDEIQFKKHKEKKKVKKTVPKVVIKKTENGSHYASAKEPPAPDLTGRKWQPWVFLEKDAFIDKMAIKNKTKALFSHRKNTYILAENFKKYKAARISKFIISQKNNISSPQGRLKYTIKLKKH